MAESRANGIARRYGSALALGAGILALILAMLAGVSAGLFDAIADPPPIVRAALAGAAIVAGAWLLRLALQRINGSMTRDEGRRAGISDADLGVLVRGVRFVFLAAAAFTAAGGWILGHPLPLVVALVIAGIDVVETSFLLLVASARRSRD